MRPTVPPPGAIEQPMRPHTPKGKTTVTSVVRTHAEDVLYHEEYTPCFLWTLVLAPCFMPFVWCVLRSLTVCCASRRIRTA
jgi:hypothetical protein